jgi:hypothetical protein
LEIVPTCCARDGSDSKILQGLGISVEALQLLEEIAAHAGEGEERMVAEVQHNTHCWPQGNKEMLPCHVTPAFSLEKIK